MSDTPVVAFSEGPSRPIAIVGTTASGKSAVAMVLARLLGNVEIVSVDSMQVYRGMDIGTAKPTAAERAEIPHHMLDLVDPCDPYDVHTFQSEVRRTLADIDARGKRALLVGGTGLYLRSVVDDLQLAGTYPEVAAELATETDVEAMHRRLAQLDPLAASRMEPGNRRRVMRALEVTLGSGRPFSSFGPGLDVYPPTRFEILGIWRPRPVVAERIAARYQEQMTAGFLDEVRRLHEGPPLSHTAAQALGYRELLGHLRGETGLAEAVDLAVTRTRRFARRQRVWFRRDPRITWFGAGNDPLVVVPMLERHISELLPGTA